MPMLKWTMNTQHEFGRVVVLLAAQRAVVLAAVVITRHQVQHSHYARVVCARLPQRARDDVDAVVAIHLDQLSHPTQLCALHRPLRPRRVICIPEVDALAVHAAQVPPPAHAARVCVSQRV